MLITVMTNGRVHTMALPDAASGMRWIESSDAQASLRLAQLEAHDGIWVMTARRGMSIRDTSANVIPSVNLGVQRMAAYDIGDGTAESSIIVSPNSEGDRTFSILGFTRETRVTIGRIDTNTFTIDVPFVSGNHAVIEFKQDQFIVTDLGSANGTYVNGLRLAANSPYVLHASDVVEIIGFVVTVGHRFLCCNHPEYLSIHSDPAFSVYHEPEVPGESRIPAISEEDDAEEPSYFYPAPRFKRNVTPFAVTVDAPPAAQKADETSVAMKIGPSMVMAFASVFSAASSITRINQPGGSLMSALPMLVMAFSMVVGSVLWPVISQHVQKKQRIRDDRKRHQRYAEYLDGVRARIAQAAEEQRQILCENRISVQECRQRVASHDSRMMDRTVSHDDFLELRLGVGTVPLNADIRYPEEHFAVEKDDLSQVVYELAKEPKDVANVPISVKFARNSVVGISGDAKTASALLRGVVLQLAALHSYEDVKLVLLCDERDRESWVWAEELPHMFSNDRAERYFAGNPEEAAELALRLGKVAQERREAASGAGKTVALPWYVVVCTSKSLMEKSDLVDDLARCPAPGFTLVCQAETRGDLPKQCSGIVDVAPGVGTLFDINDASGHGQQFVPDALAAIVECLDFSHALASVRLDTSEAHASLPDSLGFLDMYEAGNVEQLNVRSRWKNFKAADTLAARVGVDAQGEPFNLNLHEKFHGPHGLIAGTTGSGKSEFIITWILSMCVEYSPEEVAFVLIDYKGGGLAGAFDNSRVRLPHLAGTITNLGGNAIMRSLVSIQSELKRRQALFNKARDIAGGDNVDIYDYLRMYRDGKVSEPCPHLFIVADEFAELKAQQPDFMTELISAARIGRSLGVHLVLATQKPSGVVNDQIWSNSRFKVCLKVSDAGDSKEMIRRPDAAELTQAGRFYLLVGYNEMFALGQASYTGGPYVPAEQYMKKIDDSVDLISNLGATLGSARPVSAATQDSQTPQLVAVLEHIADIAKSEHLQAQPLWLDPLPALLTVGDVEKARVESRGEVSGNGQSHELDPVVGILDDPARQQQRVLTLPLTTGGNAVLYGGTGSGVESVLLAMLFDLVKTHTAAECNIYAIDFGSEALTALRGAPQVGDVLVGGEDEKVERLFDYLESVVTQRRNDLIPYGGSFARYTAEHDDMAAIVLVINGIAAFTEQYEQMLMDRLVRLSREGTRTGISIILVAASQNDIRGRLRSNFKIRLVFALDNTDDYLSVLGSMHSVAVPENYAQGLVKEGDDTFLFQGVQVLGENQDEFGYVKSQCAQIDSADSSAVSVPVMPETVDVDYLALRARGHAGLPFGVYSDDLSLAEFDFAERPIERVAFNRLKEGDEFISAVLRLGSELSYNVALVDAAKHFAHLPGICAFETQNDNEALDYICGLSKEQQDRKIVFISGVSGLLMRALPDKAKVLSKALTNAGGALCFVLFDVANDVTYNSDDWFLAHSSAQNGVWIGGGLDGQSHVQHVYGSGEKVDPKVKAPWGYVVLDGAARKVNLLTDVESEGNVK